MIRTVWRQFVDQAVQDVPGSLAVCEFDCRAVDCPPGAWAWCAHRLARLEPRRRASAAAGAAGTLHDVRPDRRRDGRRP
jgi:hypothetical protein